MSEPAANAHTGAPEDYVVAVPVQGPISMREQGYRAGYAEAKTDYEANRAEIERLRAELERYHQLHDFLDERVKEAMPVMLAEYVIADGPLPKAFPGLDAVVVHRALEQINEAAADAAS